MPQMTQTLPLLPLTSGVILPGMVFTMALETEEARVAVEAAGSAGGRLVLVPHIDGRYSVIGVVAEIVERGEIPGGPPAMIVRGLERAAIGTGVPGTGQALWVQVEPISEGPATDDVAELAAVQRALLDAAIESVRPGGVVAYVTCSPHLAETRGVVTAVADRRGDVLLLRGGEHGVGKEDCAVELAPKQGLGKPRLRGPGEQELLGLAHLARTFRIIQRRCRRALGDGNSHRSLPGLAGVRSRAGRRTGRPYPVSAGRAPRKQF